jgi:hypothetical protein
MKLSPHEQRMLNDLQRSIQAEDPAFFARMTRSHVRRGWWTAWRLAMFLTGLFGLVFGAILARPLPGLGVCISVAGYLTMLWGAWLLYPGGRQAWQVHRQRFRAGG